MGSKKVLRLSENRIGRDFVVGDIHGAYDLVIAAMKDVKFDPKSDRILSVGDLIDRGKGSSRVLGFLEKDYVFAVSGNHDKDFESLDYEGLQTLAGINWNGMGWAKNLSRELIMAIQKKLSELPIVIEVPTARGLVGLVHGDVPEGMDWPTFVAHIEAGDEQVTEYALTGRDRIQNGDMSGVAGIGRVFVGHTICWEGPRNFSNVYAVDTGAVFADISNLKEDRQARGYLTMANICAATSMLVQPELGGISQSGSRTITFSESHSSPFSTYSDRRGG
jgi:serine/threonine protein phosphatase 1